MYKTAKCIKMLMILYTRDKMSIKELAEELEVEPRNIPEYKKELEKAGYQIETVRGFYGGYRLKKEYIFPAVRLTDTEKRALVESYEYITKRGDLPSMPAYKTAMESVMAVNRYRTGKDSDLIMIPRYTLALTEEALQTRYSMITECISKKIKLKISFRSKSADVNAVAGSFGGGGHVLASGCLIHGFYEDVKEKILRAISINF